MASIPVTIAILSMWPLGSTGISGKRLAIVSRLGRPIYDHGFLYWGNLFRIYMWNKYLHVPCIVGEIYPHNSLLAVSHQFSNAVSLEFPTMGTAHKSLFMCTLFLLLSKTYSHVHCAKICPLWRIPIGVVPEKGSNAAAVHFWVVPASAYCGGHQRCPVSSLSAPDPSVTVGSAGHRTQAAGEPAQPWGPVEEMPSVLGHT